MPDRAIATSNSLPAAPARRAMRQGSPVLVEVLNADGTPGSTFAATLLMLTADLAFLLVSARGASAIHWGAGLRVRMEDERHYCEVCGCVVAHTAGAGDTQDPRAALREVLVRVWSCSTGQQKRKTARAPVRLPLSFKDASRRRSPWSPGHCMDVSPSSLRVRIARDEPIPEIIRIKLALPRSSKRAGCLQFEARGRVVLTRAVSGPARRVDIIVRLERLTVDQGIALARYLAAAASSEP